MPNRREMIVGSMAGAVALLPNLPKEKKEPIKLNLPTSKWRLIELEQPFDVGRDKISFSFSHADKDYIDFTFIPVNILKHDDFQKVVDDFVWDIVTYGPIKHLEQGIVVVGKTPEQGLPVLGIVGTNHEIRMIYLETIRVLT